MKKLVVSMFVVALTLSMFAVTGVHALDFGTEITVFDGIGSGTTGWNRASEDQEVAQGCVGEQGWDLEGMFLQGSELGLVGGFDFQNGKWDSQSKTQITSGDIFIDVTGDIVYGQNITGLKGNGNKDVNNQFGYDYAIDLNFDGDTLTYDVYQIDQTATLTMGWYRQNDTSGAWEYKNGGTLVQSGLIGSYQAGLSNADTGFLGGSHNALSLDLSFLGSNVNFTAQFTMSCGNDLLVGQGTTPVVATPEPGTLALVGLGLLGAVMLKRKTRK